MRIERSSGSASWWTVNRPALTAAPAYAGATFALLTQHGKEQVFAPLFREVLGAQVELISGFDTDTLGTFTRDIPRAGSQLEAVRKKARLALELSGRRLGLASEGAFTPGPFGLGSLNLELVLLIDAEWGVEILGQAYAAGHHSQAVVENRAALEALAHASGFPAHGLVLRPDGEQGAAIRKGLRTWGALAQAFTAAQAESPTGAVILESDLRAHMHPTRMRTIAAAVRDLLERMCSRCGACDAPGFGVVSKVRGLPCADCGDPTEVPRADEWGCVACAHREIRDLMERAAADPAQCNGCNP